MNLKFYLAGRDTGPFFPAKKKTGGLTGVQINRIVAEVGKMAGPKFSNPRRKTGNINLHLLRPHLRQALQGRRVND